MSKTASLTIRVEDDLRQQFNDAAAQAHRPAAQVLRELMRGYVADFNRQPLMMSPEELDRREAVDFALANSELEGFETSETQKELFERYAMGEITGEELDAEIDEMAAAFVADNRA